MTVEEARDRVKELAKDSGLHIVAVITDAMNWSAKSWVFSTEDPADTLLLLESAAEGVAQDVPVAETEKPKPKPDTIN